MPKLPLLLALAALAGCEIYSSPGPAVCPGSRVGVFSFVASLPPASACSFASQALTNTSFNGTITFDADGGPGACLSLDQPHAVLNLGTHAGNALSVGSDDIGGALNGCNCPPALGAVALRIGQTFAGTISPGVDAGPDTFDGNLTTAVDAVYPDGGSADAAVANCGCGTVESDGGCSCTLPCSLVYDLAATAVFSP